jgi:hypothetical protein
VAMMTDDLFGDHEDPEFATYAANYDALMLMISEFSEERGIGEGLVAGMLLETALSMCSLGYVLSVAKPSESGLKLELDRFHRGFVDLVRLSKKDAKETVARMQAILDMAEPEDTVDGE